MAHVTGTKAPAAGPELPERYALVNLVGVGGMASIWAADDQLLGRRVAIKVLAEQFAQQPRFVVRFQREARTAAQLSGHPHIITTYDVGEHRGRPFIVMEHLGGGTFAGRMAEAPPSREVVVRWLREAASALDFAHEKGVVHRDVKPRNLLFDDRDRLVVADFGIARAAFEESLTASEELLGTAAYISPEQALGEAATAASDRYALAVVAFEALTGGLPFGGGTLVEIAQRRTEMDAPLASERSPDLSPAVDAVLSRGLARDPAERWPTAGEFVEALAGAVGSLVRAPAVEPVAAEVPAPAGEPSGLRTSSWYLPRGVPVYRRRRPRPSASALLLLVAAVAVGLVVWLVMLNDGGGGSERRADRAPRGSASERAAREQRNSDRAAESDRATRDRSETRKPDAAATPPPAAGSGTQSPAELNDQGFALMNAGRYDEAIPVLQKAVAGFPEGSGDLTLAYALYNLGRSLRLAGRPDEAIPVLERRLEFKNQRGVVKKELAAARRATGAG